MFYPYKIFILIIFITMAGNISLAQSLLAFHEPEISFEVKESEAPSTEALSSQSAASSFTHATFKITTDTKKINATLVQKEAVLLLHLTSPHNQVYLQASDAIGQQVMSVDYPEMEAGFYEIPVLPFSPQARLYFISLVINQKTYSFQISPTL